jgi:rubrerythrin
MAEEKYTCNKCGQTFEKRPEKHQCPLCGSPDVKQSSEQTASSCCGANTRFT